eukprot:CAMPEP_0206264942 /NCGR_PEP_ID=MMETSP0047_2-20121206/29704_1 /ASSEMBLY_ACC=CAM_ASM_000192 /TAXON_ID=195065 /ORGANISM="Chroomonas mesostigmatica_cf, Strain CCMP1168" /LENGTH=59 /DNA_ID=CAMNT_0053692751 /DNA_START=48 /DNA_END=224 /DNA_ORIENTATION=-
MALPILHASTTRLTNDTLVKADAGTTSHAPSALSPSLLAASSAPFKSPKHSFRTARLAR